MLRQRLTAALQRQAARSAAVTTGRGVGGSAVAAVPSRSLVSTACRCAPGVFRSRRAEPPTTLPIVEIKADPTLLDAVTDEIVDEFAATHTTNNKSKKKASSSRSKKSSSRSAAAPVSTTRAQASASAAAAPSLSSAVAAPVALDDQGWEEWSDISKPFASSAEEAEFNRWQRILAEEEAIVDRELAEEATPQHEDDIDNMTHQEQIELDEDEVIEAEGEIVEEEIEAEEEDDEYMEEEEEEDADADDEEAAPLSSSKPKSARRASDGVVENGVRTRMLNVGGEQVMEISGVDDDEAGDEAAEWDDDIDMDFGRVDEEDPDGDVGRGVGGVFFTRKELMELNEKDLVESYTKGSGRGGQKVNKTNSCVNLLHLPTGTRVKCQFSRELQANRARARTIMRERLEELLLGSESRTAKRAAKERRKKDRNRRRRAKKHSKDDEEGEEEQDDDEVDETEANTPVAIAAPKRKEKVPRSLK